MSVSLNEIQKAQAKIQGHILRTESNYSLSATKELGLDVYLKLENSQRTGSFKIRGALNKLMSLTESEKAKGVIASSAGNHAQGVALSATLLGVKSVVVMPESAPQSKIAATKSYGAEVILYGTIYDDAFKKAKELEAQFGYTFVHPYQDDFIIAGQGTVGLEIFEDIKNLDSVVLPLGGGGLISGVAIALKTLSPKIKIFGVQSDRAAGMQKLFQSAGKDTSVFASAAMVSALTSYGSKGTIADGIAIKYPSKEMYENYIYKYVDQVVTVTDDEIAEAIVFLMERAKTVSEGSGAASLAALFHRGLDLGKRTCAVISGGNIDMNIISKVIDRGQIKRARLCELSVIVDDLPGNLNRLTNAIAELKANILDVKHDRVSAGLSLRETRIDFVLETTSFDQVEKIKQAMEAVGAKII